MRSPSLANILLMERCKPLVGIGAFCLMPNHFHLLLREASANGISTFMRKVGTSYAMYFNIRYERTGNLFTKPFRSRHVEDDTYLQRVIQYIHSNPAELFEPSWKKGDVQNMIRLEKQLLAYPYSSFRAFNDTADLLRNLLDDSIFELETQLSPRMMLEEALEYYNASR